MYPSPAHVFLINHFTFHWLLFCASNRRQQQKKSFRFLFDSSICRSLPFQGSIRSGENHSNSKEKPEKRKQNCLPLVCSGVEFSFAFRLGLVLQSPGLGLLLTLFESLSPPQQRLTVCFGWQSIDTSHDLFEKRFATVKTPRGATEEFKACRWSH
jgi:hypothetical protein